MANKSPVKVFKSSAIRCSIFETSGQEGGVFYTASVSRCYYKNGKWEYTPTMKSSEAPTAAKLLMKAFDWMVEQESQEAVKTKKRGSPKKGSEEEDMDEQGSRVNDDEVPF